MNKADAKYIFWERQSSTLSMKLGNRITWLDRLASSLAL